MNRPRNTDVHSAGDLPWRAKWPTVLVVLGACLGTLAFKLWLASLQEAPGYGDVAHYYSLARSLYEGRGARLDCIANWLADPHGLPVSGTQYWMPMPSWIGALGMLAFGESSFRAACYAMAALTSLAPLITYLVGRDLFGSRRLGLLGALLAATFHLFVGKGTLLLSHGPALVSGGFALWALVRSLDDRRYLWAFGLCSAFAQSNRSDGILWLVVLVLAHRLRPGGPTPVARLWPAFAAHAVGIVPLVLTNLATQGRPWPSGHLRAALLTSYPELYSLPERLTLAHYFAQGAGAIARDKAGAVLANAWTFVTGLATGEDEQGWRDARAHVLLVVFAWLGARRLFSRRFAAFWLWALGAAALYSLVFTHSGPTSFRPALFALYPVFLVAAAQGILSAARALARLFPESARSAVLASVAALCCAGIALDGLLEARAWAGARARLSRRALKSYARVDAELVQPLGLDDAVFMVGQGSVYTFHALTGLRAATIPFGATAEEICAAAARVGGTHLLLEEPLPVDETWSDLAELPHSSLIERQGSAELDWCTLVLYRITAPD